MTNKPKKKFYKKWWFWLVLIVIALFIGIGGNSDKDNTASSSSEKSKTNQPAKETIHKLGESLTVGNFTYNIEKVTNAKSVGKEYSNKKTKDNFVIVTVNVKNVAKDASTLDSSLFTLINKEGQEFKSDWEATLYANLNLDASDDGNSANFASLNPGISKTVKIVFETPKQSTEDHYDLILSGGFTSTKNATVSIN